jgi:hypothetical protein
MKHQIGIQVIPLVIYVNVATSKINAGKNLTTFHCTQKNIVH